MLEILYSKIHYNFLDQTSYDKIETLRKDFSVFEIQDLHSDRPLLISENQLKFFTFSGTRINRTIELLLNIAGIKNHLDESECKCVISTEIPKQELISQWSPISLPLSDIDSYISKLLQINPALLDFSKWGIYLPEDYQVKLIKDKYFDIEQTQQLLATMKLIVNK